jgi:hypothetical protein
MKIVKDVSLYSHVKELTNCSPRFQMKSEITEKSAKQQILGTPSPINPIPDPIRSDHPTKSDRIGIRVEESLTHPTVKS